nr:hypothetical protein [Tanacetum cinerariifolium]
PRSASAKHSAIPGKSQGIKNLPGSPNFLAFGLGFEALTGAIAGSEIGEVTGLEIKIGDSDWTA